MTRDFFGRTVTTHRCPECRAEFGGPAKCKGIGGGPGKRAHAKEIQTKAIVGCCEPPAQTYAVVLPRLFRANKPWQVQEMVDSILADHLPPHLMKRYAWMFSAQPLETRTEATFNRLMENQRRRTQEREARHAA